MLNTDFTERTGTVASKTIRSKYPAQIAVMTTDENKERFQAEAERDGVSVAEVIRGYLEAGIDAADGRRAPAVYPTPEPRTGVEHDRQAQYRGLL